jgi:hypothetical protein
MPSAIPAPYPYILILIKSVGLATVIPMVPVIIPATIFYGIVGFTPSGSGPVTISLIGTYKPILNPPYTSYLYKPGTRPLYKALGPSSALMTFIQ